MITLKTGSEVSEPPLGQDHALDHHRLHEQYVIKTHPIVGHHHDVGHAPEVVRQSVHGLVHPHDEALGRYPDVGSEHDVDHGRQLADHGAVARPRGRHHYLVEPVAVGAHCGYLLDFHRARHPEVVENVDRGLAQIDALDSLLHYVRDRVLGARAHLGPECHRVVLREGGRVVTPLDGAGREVEVVRIVDPSSWAVSTCHLPSS